MYRPGREDENTFDSCEVKDEFSGGFQELQKGENKELLFNGYRLPVWDDKKFQRWMVTIRMDLIPLNCTLEMVKMDNFVTYILP